MLNPTALTFFKARAEIDRQAKVLNDYVYKQEKLRFDFQHSPSIMATYIG